jgi:hypothetical protein
MKPRVVFGVERQRLAWPGRVQGPFVCSVHGITIHMQVASCNFNLHAMIMAWRVAILIVICVY